MDGGKRRSLLGTRAHLGHKPQKMDNFAEQLASAHSHEMDGRRRRSMLGSRNHLGLKPRKMNIAGSQLGKRSDSSDRKNHTYFMRKSPVKSEQGVVKRLFDDTIKMDKKSPSYTRLSSSIVVKDESPLKIDCSTTKGNKNLDTSQIHPQSKLPPESASARSKNSTQNFDSASLSDGNRSKVEASKTTISKFNPLNSSHYSYLSSGKTLESPKSPILWSNACKYRQPINIEPLESPEEPVLLSRTFNMLTSTVHKNTSNASSKENGPNPLKLESPNLSAIKVIKPAEKPLVSADRVKNLYSFHTTNTSLSNTALKNETVNDDTVMANNSNDDSFLDNETMCLMEADQTVKTANDSKETTLKNTSTSMNKTVLPTPRKLSVISEEIIVKRESVSHNPNPVSDERLIVLMDCVNNLVINKEEFLNQQNILLEQVKVSQEQFFLKQNEILEKVSNVITQMGTNTNTLVNEKKISPVLVNPPKNVIVTSRIAGNGNDDDEDSLSVDLNDGNNALICATKKLRIFDENSETPRRSARILEKVDSARKNNESIVQTPDSLKTKHTSGYLSSTDADETLSEFKENSLRTPMNQKSNRSSGNTSRFYTAKKLSPSIAKSSLKTPTGPRKSLGDKNFSKCETPNKKSKKSPLSHGRRSLRLNKIPSALENDTKSEQDNATILMRNLRQSCPFLKTPRNSNRMSINTSNILTPHTMSFVVHDQMKNIFNS